MYLSHSGKEKALEVSTDPLISSLFKDETRADNLQAFRHLANVLQGHDQFHQSKHCSIVSSTLSQWPLQVVLQITPLPNWNLWDCNDIDYHLAMRLTRYQGLGQDGFQWYMHWHNRVLVCKRRLQYSRRPNHFDSPNENHLEPPTQNGPKDWFSCNLCTRLLVSTSVPRGGLLVLTPV